MFKFELHNDGNVISFSSREITPCEVDDYTNSIELGGKSYPVDKCIMNSDCSSAFIFTSSKDTDDIKKKLYDFALKQIHSREVFYKEIGKLWKECTMQ